jgi:heme exporter protein D
MGNLWRLFEWIGLSLGIVIAGLATALLLARRRIMHHVEGELGREALLLAANARVSGFDGGPGGKPRPSPAGILMLLASGLYFHSWTGSQEVFIPGPSISWIGVSDAREGSRWERPRIVVRFLNAAGKEDGFAIRLLYPVQWVAAIKTHLITHIQ